MTARILGHAKFRDGFGGESSRLAFLPRNRLWGASLAVLAMAAVSPASAANFIVNSEAELRSAIDAANANADATDTITLANDIVISDPTAFPALTNPVTINTGAFTLSGSDTATGITPGTSLSFGGGNLTVTGNAQGGDSAPDAGSVIGGTGISGNGTAVTVTNGSTVTGGAGGDDPGGNPAGRGGVGVNLLDGTLINNGTIQGGVGGDSATNADGSGGTGVVLDGGDSHVNNGIIRGGLTSVTGSPTLPASGNGLALRNGTLVNNGTIEGGPVVSDVAVSAANTDGAYLQGEATIINNSGGIIRGGGTGAGGRPGDGITVFNANNTIINRGTISGAPGGTFGIVAFIGASNLTIVNSGTIQGDGVGPGTNTAIAAPGSRMTLELQSGSTIIGDVIASVGQTGDVLRLGGDEDDSFDVSAIGAAQQYRNFNIFEKTGASTWTITGQGTNQVAPWDIYAGTLLMSEGSDLGDGPVDLIGGTLAGLGTVGSTTAAAGTVISPGIPGVNNGIGTLTIDGDYTGNGGLLDIQTVLGDDGSLTDLLQINGGTSGTTLVQVTNLGGTGAPTVEGIKIVNVDGTSDGDFNLLGDYAVNGEQAVIGGAYAYSLFQGSVSAPDDGDWYLRSILADDGTPLFQPAAPLYEAYAGTLQAFNQLGTLQQRVGNRSWAGAMGLEQGADAVTDLTGGEPRNSGLWARIEGADGHFEPENSTTGTDYDTSLWRLQAGLDMLITENDDGSLIGGVNVFYGSIDSDVESLSGSGSIDSDGYGVGGTLTWYGNSGFYVDGVAQATWYQSDLASDALGSLVEENDGTGYALSIEAGRKFAIASNWSTTPQAQLVWSSVDFDGFTDGFGTDVSLDGSDSLVGRLGITADYEAFGQDAEGRVTRSHFYGIGNLYYDFEDGSTTNVGGTELVSENESLWGGLGIGGTYNWADDKYSVYGEALVKTGLENFGDSHVLYGTVGFRTSW